MCVASVFTAWRTGKEIRGIRNLKDKEESRMQYSGEIKEKQNNWYGCNNARGKDKIGLRMERKTKNESSL